MHKGSAAKHHKINMPAAGKNTLDGRQHRQQETACTQPTEVWRPDASQEGNIRAKSRRTSTTEKQVFKDPGSTSSSGRLKSSEQEPRDPRRRRIRSGFVAFSSFRYQLTCKSPSTDSTTSLAQLRDKLAALSPPIFNKVPRKVASSPELPSIKELDEHPKGIRCGYAKKSHSDTEIQLTTDKNRHLSPAKEKQSASLLLVAALDNTNESVKDDIFDNLYKDNPNFDLADLLMVEALQHGQEKDSRISSGKVTQNSDIVENTPVEKNVRHKKLSIKRHAKSIVENKPATDDSDIEFIDDTPCYVYDRKERGRTNNAKAVSKTSTVEIETLNDKAVDEFFSQHVNQNTGNIVISPTLAKKINETPEASDDDCAIINECFVDNELNISLALEEDIVDCMNSVLNKVCNDFDQHVKLFEKQKYQIDMLSFAQNVGDSSNSAPDVSKTSKTSLNKLKTDKNMSEETKKVTLKYKPSKKTAPKMNISKKPNKAKDTSKIEKSNILRECTNTSSPINITKVASTRKKRKLYSPQDDEKANNETPVPRTKAERKQTNVNQTLIATCYRELENVRESRRISSNSRASTRSKRNSKKPRYNISSESDDEDPSFQIKKRSHYSNSSSKESTTTLSKPERSVKPVNYTEFQYSPLPSSSSDSEYESDHNRAKKTRVTVKTKPRSRKMKKKSRTQSVLSPKPKKMNEMFDAIKENVINDEKVTLVEKKSAREYNLSSESEDGDFKKKKSQVQKRVSSTSLESSATKRQRLINRVNYTVYYSSEDEGKKTRKTKTVTQAKQRSRKMKKIPKDNLIDERMRATQDETLETSFVKETVDANYQAEPEPQLEQAPVLEVIPPEKLPDDATEVIVLENKTTPDKLDIIKIKKENNASKKVTKSTLTKKGKEISKDESKDKDSTPVSPLPGLLVETERTRKDDFTSSIEADLLQKFKRIYTVVHNLSATDGTQQLLLNVSGHDNAGFDPTEMSETVLEPDARSELTIATDGTSPITAHNDLNESPPNVGQLNENYEHRDVHNEGMNSSFAEFLDNIRNQLQLISIPATAGQTSPVIPITRAKSIRSTRCNLLTERVTSEESINKPIAESSKSNPTVKLGKISSKEIESDPNPMVTPKSRARSPSVVLTRISSDEIEKYSTPTRKKKSSDTGTPKIVLERISSEEINKWLPLPKFKDEERKNDERPYRYNTRLTSSKSTDVSKNIPSNTTMNKTKISPVKLNFNVLDLTMASDTVTKAVRTRSSTKTVNNRATTMNKEPAQIESIASSASVAKIAQSGKSKQEKTPMSIEDRSEHSKSMASVQDWLKRNVTPNSPKVPAYNHALDEMRCKITEALQVKLPEIHQATAERWTAAFKEDQEVITCLEAEMRPMIEQQSRLLAEMKRMQERISELKKGQRVRVSEMLRADAEKKTLMLKLLLEDIEQVFKHN